MSASKLAEQIRALRERLWTCEMDTGAQIREILFDPPSRTRDASALQGEFQAFAAARRGLDEILKAHDAAQGKGERVRLAVWRDRNGVLDGRSHYDPAEWAKWVACPPPDFFVTFTLPERAPVLVVEGRVAT